jgi:hypoxanthine phosphoribosyltransferase
MSAPEATQEIKVDWATYHLLIERLVVLVHQSGSQFDQILCLARGGLRVGDVFSRIFRLPLAMLATSSYRENAGHLQGALEIAPFITMTQGTLKGRVLVVDDLVDSGETLQGVCRHLLRTYPSIETLKTAVIWYKSCSSVEPDFFVEKLETNPWIHQPFEIYDSMSPLDLVEKSTIDRSK